jgi:hydroxyacylglutathione hydrolase
MKVASLLSLLFLLSLNLFSQNNDIKDLIIKRQVSGPADANSYLIYNAKSKEVALIDVAGPIDTLLAYIEDNNLKLKYFFFTHGHFDHVMGLPEVRDQFPEAKVCIHRDDYYDMLVQLEWVLNNMDENLLNNLKSDAKLSKLLEFDASTFGNPDIFIEDGQIFSLGNLMIKAIHSPGHSRGSVVFNTKNMLFTGDVLFYRSVGRTDVQNSSREDQIKSEYNLFNK